MSRLLTTAALAALGSAAILLAACSGSSETARMTCPKVIAAPGAETIVVFAGSGHAEKDVMAGGKIRSVGGACTPEKVGMKIDTEISFEAQRVNNEVISATTFPYFVALVDPDQHILREDGFQLEVKFIPGEPYRRMPAERITVHVPVKDKSAGAAYTVVVGFQLTPDQLAFNRAAKAQ
jgi:hypothetical protein